MRESEREREREIRTLSFTSWVFFSTEEESDAGDDDASGMSDVGS